MSLVKFLPGDGTEYWLDVKYIASDYPRGKDGMCAFCRGDPCGEQPTPEPDDEIRSLTFIQEYYADNPTAETCPMCRGRPT